MISKLLSKLKSILFKSAVSPETDLKKEKKINQVSKIYKNKNKNKNKNKGKKC